jgi:hypothetical protein
MVVRSLRHLNTTLLPFEKTVNNMVDGDLHVEEDEEIDKAIGKYFLGKAWFVLFFLRITSFLVTMNKVFRVYVLRKEQICTKRRRLH